MVWTENTASLVRNPDSTLQYFVAGVVDITGRKDAETAAANLSGRLIQAQEDHRCNDEVVGSISPTESRLGIPPFRRILRTCI